MLKEKIQPPVPIKIGIVLYDGFDSLDVAGPNQIFYFLGLFDRAHGGVELYHIGPEAGALVTSLEGLKWEAGTDYQKMKDVALDVIFVPGGAGAGYEEILEYQKNNGAHPPRGASKKFRHLLENKEDVFKHFYHFLRTQVQNADEAYQKRQRQSPLLVTSVCTGALLLARAGLLEGFTCTTHWAYKNILSLFPGVNVAPGFPRYVIDRNRISGGGISSGIDEALAIVEILRGPEMARQIQLAIQYAPNPPFSSGDPSVASASTLYTVSENFDTGELYQVMKKKLARS